MTEFDRIDAQRILTAAAGAFLLSSACVLSAVGPARAAEIAPTPADWQKQVERQIDANLHMPMSVRADTRAVASVKIRFDSLGRFDDATIVSSTGNAVLDAEALRTARSIRYPALPATTGNVVMQLYFGQPVPSAASVREQAGVALEADAMRHTRTAGLPQG